MLPTPEALASGIFLGYIIFYSGYSRLTGRIEFNNIKQILLCEISAQESFRQLNKVCGLTALTLVALSFILYQYSALLATALQAGTLCSYGINIGRLHGIYSMYQFRHYYNNSSYQIAMVLGSMSFFATFLIEGINIPTIPPVDAFFAQVQGYGAANRELAALTLVGVATAHVLMMERKKGESFGFLKPQMRPAGLVSVGLGLIAIVWLGAAYGNLI